MTKDVLITPGSGIIEFKDTAVQQASIYELNGDLHLDANGGDVVLGDGTAANVVLGDALTAVSLSFLGGGTLSSSGNAINLGSTGDTVNLNVSGVTYNLPSSVITSADYTAADVLTKLKTVDGVGSGLDADFLDGLSSASTNTASSIVARDASGNFSAGTISAALSGNATTATTLQTARTINGVSFNGSANITIADATKLPLSGGTLTGLLNYRMLINQTTANYDTAGDASGFSVFYGTSAATNKPPGTDHAVTTRSYSDAWQVQDAADWRTNARYIRKQELSVWSAWQRVFADDYHPNADTLTTARTIAITGDLTYTSGSFNGSANVTGTGTLANSGVTAGTYTKITVDAKGRATSGTTLVAADIPNLDAAKITTGTIDAARLPSYVDDVVEGTNLASFPVTGETGKIYVALDTNKTYRWSGSAYVYITSGAVDSVAGKTGVVTLVKADVGLSSVDNTSDAAKPVSTAQQTALNLKANIASPVFTGNVTGLGVATGTSFNGITGLATVAPLVAGTAAVGTSALTARQDHVHPLQTTVSGNAGSATVLQTARTINGVSFNGSANITVTASTTSTLTRGTYLTGNNFNGSAATTWAVDATNANTASKVVARDASGNFSAGTITAALTGNASTATTLQTARTIGGVSFNGSANINLPGVNAAGNQNTTGSAASVSGTTTAAVLTSALASGTANSTTFLRGDRTWATVSGGITVSDDTTTNATRYLTFTSATSGTISAENVSSTKLTFNPSTGELGATNVNSLSDAKAKENVSTIESALQKTLALRGVKYTLIESQQKSIGVIAQEVEQIIPEVVSTATNGTKSVSYGNIVGLLIEAIKEQQSQIDELKAILKHK